MPRKMAGKTGPAAEAAAEADRVADRLRDEQDEHDLRRVLGDEVGTAAWPENSTSWESAPSQSAICAIEADREAAGEQQDRHARAREPRSRADPAPRRTAAIATAASDADDDRDDRGRDVRAAVRGQVRHREALGARPPQLPNPMKIT